MAAPGFDLGINPQATHFPQPPEAGNTRLKSLVYGVGPFNFTLTLSSFTVNVHVLKLPNPILSTPTTGATHSTTK